MSSDVESLNQQNIDLAYRTLVFLGQLTDDEIPPSLANEMRNIIANLCDFQYRFSVPMELPFGFGRDLEQKLPTPRPIKELVRWKVAYPIPDDLSPIGSQQDDDIIVDSDGRTYALAGHKTWNKLVQEGRLVGSDALPPQVNSHNWIKDLFSAFSLTTKLDEDRRAIARRLAACWYYVCTQVSFVPLTEEERAEEATGSATNVNPSGLLVQLMTGGMLNQQDEPGSDEDADNEGEENDESQSEDQEGEEGGEGEEEGEGDEEEDEEDEGEADEQRISLSELLQSLQGDEDDEDDEDYDPEKDPDQGEDEEIEEDDAEEEGEDESENAETDVKNDQGKEPEKNESQRAQATENKIGGEEEEDDDLPPDLLDVNDEEAAAQENEFRSSILKTVEELGAYVPDPTTDLDWFKRVLKGMAVATKTDKLAWYPWGIPPIEALKKSLKSSDKREVELAANVLKMYMQDL